MRTADDTPTPGDPKALLDQHRRDIQALDRRILHLMCERLAVARQIGELKNELGVPLRNFEVETMVHRRFEEACAFLGLDRSLGRDLALFLIQKAVEEQATLRDVVYQGDALDTLVVGGKGGMGRWIGRFLTGQGHRVRVYDPAPGSTPFVEESSLAAAAEMDLIMVAVPMTDCGAVLEQVAALGPRGVVAEMCSLKGHLLPVIERLRGDGHRIVSFHPMFGPEVRMLSDLTIVFCSDAQREDLNVVRGLFEDTSARLVEMPLTEHDRRMGLVLGLTHLSNLVFARAVTRSGVAAREMAEVAGVTFGKQLGATREVVAENPGLYYEIQALNQQTPEIGGWLRQAVDDWLLSIDGGRPDDFKTMMESCRDYLVELENGSQQG